MMVLAPQSCPRIAFVDPCCRAGYDMSDLNSVGLGGTEATVLRVGGALRANFRVAVYQHGRTARAQPDDGEMRPLKEAFTDLEADVIVVINRWKVALKLRKLYPDKPIFLWLHVYPGQHNRNMGPPLRAANIPVICVSETHARTFATFLAKGNRPHIGHIYNPIADCLRPDDTSRDPNRLLFASSPHKGLSEVFSQFTELRKRLPNLILAVADPGYLSWDVGPVPDRVIFLGTLSHSALIRQMRRALCLFYPQTTFAETFGLVMAEANAVGTPVLVHQGLGANDEILSDAWQRVNGQNPGEIAARVLEWRQSLPPVAVNPAFRLDRVRKAWSELFCSALASREPAKPDLSLTMVN